MSTLAGAWSFDGDGRPVPSPNVERITHWNATGVPRAEWLAAMRQVETEPEFTTEETA